MIESAPRTFRRTADALGRHPDLLIACIFALLAFALYLVTLAPGVLDGDSGEWQYMANILGVPHSTGYPLYLLLAKLTTLIPLGTPAWRVNLFSAVCAALVIPVVYLLAWRVSHARVAAVITAAFFAVMPTLWASGTIAEVYALNTLLVSLTLLFAVRFLDSSQSRDLYLMALCYGLGLTNHRIAFFLAPALLYVILFRRRALNSRRLIIALVLLLAPLALYSYIPIRASQLLAEQSPENWELYPRAQSILNGKVSSYYNHTLSGFFNLVTALDNRNKLGFPEADAGQTLTNRIVGGLELLREQMDPFALALAGLGVVIVIRRERPLGILLLTAGLSTAIISMLLRAESTRFYLSTFFLIGVLFLAAALAWILAKAAPIRPLYYMAIAAFALFPISAFVLNFPRMDRSQDVRYERYARSLLEDNLAQNAVLVAPWEIATTLRYFQFVEGIRSDLLVIHESPVRPQFQKLRLAANALGRPFYYAQFSPEDKNAPPPRSIRADAMPLPSAPQPRQPLEIKLTNEIKLIGYDWLPSPAVQGEVARLALYYETVRTPIVEYVADLDFGDIKGEPRGSWSKRPVSEYLPTYLWEPGSFYRDVWDIPLDPSIPSGLYNAEVLWYAFDANANSRSEKPIATIPIRALRVGDFDAPPYSHTQDVLFSNGMRLLGYEFLSSALSPNGKSVSLQAGDSVQLRLCWQTQRALEKGYTVFAHLVDESGAVRAQSDRAPWNGLFPTDRWIPGEIVCDMYELNTPKEGGAGRYTIQVGLYSNPEELDLVKLEEIGADRVTLETTVGLTPAR